ncbi:uncharacterized protein LOC105424949 [Pogonomyrmex barbatus]|uniref:Uncharacterized protein LOC105424949 n=1 Tax=Pogonomyrmex barbatus TaxID=144034 RepID=A0A6I9WPP7_9HYME|nr:uncharacterized protein LOC105424949 [Pogonomyrmex barbatus]
MPHVILNDVNKLSLLRTLDSGRYLNMGFRSWDLYEFPLLQSTTKHSWAVKAATQLEKPRYVIFALQTGRKNVPSEDVSKFDDCKLTNIKLYLNYEFYPYDDINLDFERNKRNYGCETCEPFMTVTRFLQYGPLVVIDYSRQNESIKSATVDVRVEFECKENVPANTTAYCLIIHDRVVERKNLKRWITSNHHGLQWSDGDVAYRLSKHVIRNGVCDQSRDAPKRVYVKGLEKKK